MQFLQMNTEDFKQFYPYAHWIFLAIIVIAVFLYRKNKRNRMEKEYFPQKFVSTSASATKTNLDEEEDDDFVDPVEEMASELGLRTWELKLLLGIQIHGACNVSSSEDAEAALDSVESGSDDEFLALKRWIELETDIDRMEDIEEIVDENPYLEKILYEKWDRLALEKVNSVSGKDELIDMFSQTTSGSEAEGIVLKKLYEFFK